MKRVFVLGLMLGIAPLASAAENSRELLDFSRPLDPALLTGQGAKVSFVKGDAGTVLRVETDLTRPWPGVTLKPAEGKWDLSPFNAVDVTVKNNDAVPMKLFGRVDNPGAMGADRSINAPMTIAAGATGVIHLTLKRESSYDMGGWLFGMRGYPVAPGGPGTVNPGFIKQIMVFLNLAKPDVPHSFDVLQIRANGKYVAPTANIRDADPYFPFIDTFGQYKHKDWPGKTHSLAEMAAARDAEAKTLAAQPGPTDWDQYGGWKGGPQLKATGFFRTEKVDGKWWLVDPDGRLFFSTGMDSVRLVDPTGIQDREHWFENYRGDQAEMAEFVSKGNANRGYYANKNPNSFWFAGANLKRKYGADWKNASADVIHKRLRSWGFNTIANWSDAAVANMKRTPYTAAIYTGGRPIAGSKGYWGQFADPFDAQFKANVKTKAAALRGKNDPWCLGYFSDNEWSWGNETSLAEATLSAPADQPAKKVFQADLQARYGEIGKLNSAWGSNYASWDGFLAGQAPEKLDKARPDLLAFYTRIAEEYFRTVKEALKEVAPNQLYLGCRFSLIAENPLASAAAAKYCDVVSYNVYQRSVDEFHYDGGADVPLLVGEFHFGALDRGLFHPGSVTVDDQNERAATFAKFVRSALRHPQYVGVHWFEYNDEAVTGRVWDGENYQIGFVDVADVPYAEMVNASREVTKTMYPLRAGKVQ